MSTDPNFDAPEKKIYVGKDAAEHMLDELKEDAERIFSNYIKKPKSMELTSEEPQHFNAATEFHMCRGKFAVDNKKVRGHCHILGDFRGAAHNKCNLDFKIDPKRWNLPIFFHYLKGYDGHILIRAVRKSIWHSVLLDNYNS